MNQDHLKHSSGLGAVTPKWPRAIESAVAGLTAPRFVGAKPTLYHTSRVYMTTVLNRSVKTVVERMPAPYTSSEAGTVPWSKLRWSRLVTLFDAVQGLHVCVVSRNVAKITADKAVTSDSTVARRTHVGGLMSESNRRVCDRMHRGDFNTEITNNRVNDED
jgi:hypothetical protein